MGGSVPYYRPSQGAVCIYNVLYTYIRTYEDLERWEVAFLIIAPLSMLCIYIYIMFYIYCIDKNV